MAVLLLSSRPVFAELFGRLDSVNSVSDEISDVMFARSLSNYTAYMSLERMNHRVDVD